MELIDFCLRNESWCVFGVDPAAGKDFNFIAEFSLNLDERFKAEIDVIFSSGCENSLKFVFYELFNGLMKVWGVVDYSVNCYGYLGGILYF